MLGAMAGGAAGPWALGALHDATGNYVAGFWLSLGFALISMLAIWRASPARSAPWPVAFAERARPGHDHDSARHDHHHDRTPISTDDRKAIEQAVQTYFDGLYEGDADKLASVFHETAALTFEQNGELVALPLAKWLESVRARASAKSKGLARDDAIVLFDESGPASAFVKVKCQMPPL